MRLAVGLLGLLVACKSPPSTAPAAASPESEGPSETATAAGATTTPGASSEPAEPPSTVCKRDGDCVLSTFAGCCTCCAGPARAFFKPELARLETKCQTVRCPSCDQACPDPADLRRYSALCESARCVAEPH